MYEVILKDGSCFGRSELFLRFRDAKRFYDECVDEEYDQVVLISVGNLLVSKDKNDCVLTYYKNARSPGEDDDGVADRPGMK